MSHRNLSASLSELIFILKGSKQFSSVKKFSDKNSHFFSKFNLLVELTSSMKARIEEIFHKGPSLVCSFRAAFLGIPYLVVIMNVVIF